MKARKLKGYNLFKFGTNTDDEGAVTESFATSPINVSAYVYPASGSVQSEMYGARMVDMLNMIVNLPCDITEKDGVGVYKTGKADYRVIAIKRYTEHLECTLEKV